jgi:hypothetical protein
LTDRIIHPAYYGFDGIESLHIGLNETQSPLSNGAPFQKRNFFTDRVIDMLREAILKELSGNPMGGSLLEDLKKAWPEKFVSEEGIFSHIHAGDRIFMVTGCGEPQHLISALVNYIKSKPKAFFGVELMHVWTLGQAPYTDEEFQDNFRRDSLFISDCNRNAVNMGAADYTPVSLSAVPSLFRREIIPIDMALIQTSPPDKHGYMSLGISVDIVKAATQKASMVASQINSHMPRTQGDGFIYIKDVDFVIPYDEPLLEYKVEDPGGIIQAIGRYVARKSRTSPPYRSDMALRPMLRPPTWARKSTLVCIPSS